MCRAAQVLLLCAHLPVRKLSRIGPPSLTNRVHSSVVARVHLTTIWDHVVSSIPSLNQLSVALGWDFADDSAWRAHRGRIAGNGEIRGSLDLAAPLTPGFPLGRCSPPLILISSEYINRSCCDPLPLSSLHISDRKTMPARTAASRSQPMAIGWGLLGAAAIPPSPM
jgi:hypothetical protein